MEKYSADKKCVVMSRDEVRAFDTRAINTLGIPGAVLMENAGRSCAELIKKEIDSRFRGNDKAASDAPTRCDACCDSAPARRAVAPRRKVCIFCGTGNNGGDGYVIARHLLNNNFEVVVVICGDRSKIKGDAKINLDVLEKLGQPIEQLNLNDDNIPSRVNTFAADANMLVDGLFGTGLNGQLSDEYKKLIESINSLHCPILAVDIPSGLDCDTGEPLGTAVRASFTVTFVAVKKGFTAAKASAYTGEIFIASIGVEPAD